ncbi:hypothetical protein PIROE2DRAFT_14876 [Piromyces sp. E2]|nr:hypothetical protein PIROE2DRAFT_14876 [Piromyces sp. E2]|eukprot:OUM59543.1 hypothetical protein PIROE2DRAFT_14876 [Piromyces sp. E2]
MRYFIDIITSTHYLAVRDQLKFKKLFSLFGVSSSSITKQNPLKEDYNDKYQFNSKENIM